MRPAPRLLLILAAGLPVALLPVLVHASLWVVWLAFVALAGLAAGVDAVACMRPPAVRLGAPSTLYVGSRDLLHVTVDPPLGRRAATVELLCDLDADLEAQPLLALPVPPEGPARAGIPLVPRRRGRVRLHALWLRWAGPLGLVRRQARHALGHEIPVVPDVRAVRQAALRFFTTREFLSGLKVERYLGDGSEFDSLREYVPGFDPRSIHWKSSARHRTLYCTEYRAERNHQVVVAVDSGHLMSEPLGGLPKLDRAINAALHLAYVCLRTGDRVGWYAFDAEVRAFTAPDGGTRAFRRIQQLTADLEYRDEETNFTLGLAELALRLKRRSLVVLLTDFVDTITAELMIENVTRLSRRHLVLFVTLRDPALAALAGAPPRGLADLHRAVVAEGFLQERAVVLKRLERLGVQCLDAAPDQVTTGLLNRYLEAKRRELF